MKRANLDLVVGLFVLAGFFSFVYLSVQLGEFSPFSMKRQYQVQAEFGSISGLRRGAVVEIAGVSVGRVARIDLSDRQRALVTMYIDSGVELSEDSIASIKTQGIIGEKYISISPGGSDLLLADGDWLMETESALDLEELVSKYIFGGV
ncbi:outer membrane lipid asymmetry maintenance protein MlaD [Desulfurivibrio sp. C05AmB]|jgi:phospholipid/cholesterol/gamma-HCH transport system substrate-binding protein|uniref:outer membrane lipid asymmetry maintenance protein MlaD n=1 Tax=Desulfurivibrio sp. C05AmB TaxID=3374371 RepID=UPI00376F1BCF